MPKEFRCTDCYYGRHQDCRGKQDGKSCACYICALVEDEWIQMYAADQHRRQQQKENKPRKPEKAKGQLCTLERQIATLKMSSETTITVNEQSEYVQSVCSV